MASLRPRLDTHHQQEAGSEELYKLAIEETLLPVVLERHAGVNQPSAVLQGPRAELGVSEVRHPGVARGGTRSVRIFGRALTP